MMNTKMIASNNDSPKAFGTKEVEARPKTHTLTMISNNDAEDSDSEREGSSPTNTRVSGLIIKGGRVRLPDKLMEYLNNNVSPDALYWMPEGESFAIDTEKAPEQFLSKYFGGTKMASFLRSISRWGFKRVFHHELGRHVHAFHHPLFQRDAPHLESEMKMLVSACSQSTKAKKSKKKVTKKQTAPAPESPRVESKRSPVLSAPSTASFAPVPSPTVARPTTAFEISTLPTHTTGQQQHGAPLSPENKQALLQRLLQQTPAQQLQQLLGINAPAPAPTPSIPPVVLALPPQATSDRAPASSSSHSTLQSQILNLVVARQQRQQQQQQQQAALALQILNALKSSATTQH